VIVGVAAEADFEPDLAAEEAEERRVQGAASIGFQIVVLLTGAANVQIRLLYEPLGMAKEHAPRDERPQAELVGSVDHAHPSR